ncbi:MAG: phosphotransferase family protein [Candidatus Odinarchaeota archaeon]
MEQHDISWVEKDDLMGFLINYQEEIQRNSGILFAFDQNDTDLTIVPGGSVNVNYKAVDSRGQEIFLKRQLSSGGVYGSRLRREFLVLDYLSKLGMTAYPFIYKEENRLLATSFIRGEKPSLEKNNTEEVLVSIGQFLNYLRKTPISLLKRLYTGRRSDANSYWFKDVLPTSEKIVKQSSFSHCRHLVSFLNEIIEVLSSNLSESEDYRPNWEQLKEMPLCERNITLIHNDFAFRNLIYSNSKIAMKAVDWETADAGDTAYDIGYMWSENDLKPEHVRIICQESTKGCTEDVKALMDRAYEFRPLIEVGNICWTLNSLEQRNMRTVSPLLRNPYSIAESLNYTMYKIRSLSRGLNVNISKNRLYGEVKTALKLIQTELFLLTG